MKNFRYLQQQAILKWLPNLENLYAITLTYSDKKLNAARKQDVLVNSR